MSKDIKCLKYLFILFLFLSFLKLEAQNKIEIEKVDSLLQIAHDQQDINFSKSMELTNLALSLSSSINYKKGIAKSYLYLGRIYRRKKEFETSMTFFVKASKIFEETKDYLNLASLYHSISLIHFDKFDFQKVILYEQKALEKLKLVPNLSTKDSIRYINIYNQLGMANLPLKNNQKAMAYFEKALQVAKLTNMIQMIGITYDNFSKYYSKEGKYAEALKYTNLAYGFKLKEGDIVDIANSRLDMGILYSKMKQDRTALKYFLSASELIDSIDLYEMKEDCYSSLSIVNEKLGDYKNSLKYQIKLMRLKDAFSSKQYNDKLIEIEAKYRNEQVQKENELLKNENLIKEQNINIEKNEKKNLILFLIIFICVGIVLFYYQIKIQEIRKQKSEMSNSKELAENRFIAFQARMNPHFIFNALSSIQYLITINDKNSSLLYLSKFAKLLRQVLDNSTVKKVNLLKEIELIRTYIDLESLRFENEFTYHIEIENETDLININIPSMIIQPFVENAILHGLFNKKVDGKLDIYIANKENHVYCEIKDNGIGRKKSEEINRLKHHKHESQGMQIASERLRIIQSEIIKQEPIEILDLYNNNEPAGTLIKLILPKL